MLEVIGEFVKVHGAFVMSQGISPMIIQSDNGEFDSKKVRYYSMSNGIVQRFSLSYHSITNGPVERMIRKIKEMGRAMMIDKKSPQEFW